MPANLRQICQGERSWNDHRNSISFVTDENSPKLQISKNDEGNNKQLNKFLEEMMKEEYKTTRVLKCVSQNILAVPFMQLKFAWPEKFPFEDEPNEWAIFINVVRDQEVRFFETFQNFAVIPLSILQKTMCRW